MIELNATSARPDDTVAPQLPRVIAEFGRHLETLADQLGASLVEADRECVSVGESFHELAAAKAAIDGIDCPEPVRSMLQDTARQMGDSLHSAVVALQYHDRLAQRLGLVRAALDRLQTLLHSGSARSQEEWLRSLEEVERLNRTERQRLGPEKCGARASGGPDEDAVELF